LTNWNQVRYRPRQARGGGCAPFQISKNAASGGCA